MNDALVIAHALIRFPTVTPHNAGALGVVEPENFLSERVRMVRPRDTSSI